MLILGNNNAYAPDLFAGAESQGGGSSIPTTLGSRIDNKATVVGVLQDHEGNDYVLAVVDAAYRSGEAMAWTTYKEFDPGGPAIPLDTPIQNNSNKSAALADKHSGKYNTDLILSTYTATDYPAFNFAKNACTVTIGSNTYYSVLPSLNELQLLWNNKNALDQYDPTVSDYSSRSMNSFSFGGSTAWSTNEYNAELAWTINEASKKEYQSNGVCPVICIPLS